MSYYIRRKFSDYDDGYVDRWGEGEGTRFEAQKFDSKEEAQKSVREKTWKLDGLSSDFEIVDH